MRISDWSSDVCSSDLHLFARRLGDLADGPRDRSRSECVTSSNLRRLEAPQGWSSRRQPLVKAGGQEKERMTNEQLATNRESARPVSQAERADRKSVVSGKSVSVRVDLGGRRIIKKNKKPNT